MKEIYSTGGLALEGTVIQTSTISASKALKLFYISFELKSGSVFFVRLFWRQRGQVAWAL